MKKTLVFYKGRAPKGEKSNWVCHEYRLEGKSSIDKPAKNDWVISRVFQKTSGGKKVHISGLIRNEASAATSALPPLMDPSPYSGRTKPDSGHVHCFSSSNAQDDYLTCFNTSINLPPSSNPMDSFLQFPPLQAGFGPGPVPLQDPSIIRTFLANYGQSMSQGLRKQRSDMVSMSQETVLSTENSSVEMGKKPFEDHEAQVEPQGLDCIWSY